MYTASPCEENGFARRGATASTTSVVFRSADRGVTWKPISPDLTASVNRDALQMMGATVSDKALSRHDGQSSYSTLTSISESPLDAKVIYTGSDDGQLYVTRDAARNGRS